MTILSSIATPRVVNMTTSCVANDDTVVTVISFPFHCTKPSMWYSQLQEARCIQNMSRWAQCSEYVPLTRQCFCVFHWEYSSLKEFQQAKHTKNMSNEKTLVNTLRQRQNGGYFADNMLKCTFFKERFDILIQISLKFVTKVPIDDMPTLIQIMAWHRTGAKPLSESMMTFT